MSIPQFLSISLQDPVLSFETDHDQPQPVCRQEATTNTSGLFEPPEQPEAAQPMLDRYVAQKQQAARLLAGSVRAAVHKRLARVLLTLLSLRIQRFQEVCRQILGVAGLLGGRSYGARKEQERAAVRRAWMQWQRAKVPRLNLFGFQR